MNIELFTILESATLRQALERIEANKCGVVMGTDPAKTFWCNPAIPPLKRISTWRTSACRGCPRRRTGLSHAPPKLQTGTGHEMKTDIFSLQGRVVVITGAAGLLGRRHADAVAAFGGVPVLLDLDLARTREVARRKSSRSTAQPVAHTPSISHRNPTSKPTAVRSWNSSAGSTPWSTMPPTTPRMKPRTAATFPGWKIFLWQSGKPTLPWG